MEYTDIYSRKDVQIPTWLSFIVVLFVVVFISVVFFRSEPPSSKASKNVVKRIELTNLSSSQVAIFWQTEQSEPGWVVFGENEKNLNRLALDERDFQGNKIPRRMHYVALKNLNPATKYYFKLTNEKEIFADPEGRSFTFSTLSRSSRVSNLKPAYGKITDASGSPLDNIVVLLSIKDAQLLSTLSKTSGEWLIPLNYILDKKTKSLKTVAREESIRLDFYSESGERSTVQTNSLNLSPLPETITLGKDYNLDAKQEILSVTDNKSVAIEILFPKENAVIPGTSPLIRGKGIPGREVTIAVSDEKKDVSAKAKIGGNGLWSVTLANPLSAGKHTLTVKTNDADGKEKTLSRNFSIAKSGEQVLGEATGAATVSATPTASASPLLTETPSPPVSGGNLSYLTFSSLVLITMGLWLLVFAL